jgi:hypothetical protein
LTSCCQPTRSSSACGSRCRKSSRFGARSAVKTHSPCYPPAGCQDMACGSRGKGSQGLPFAGRSGSRHRRMVVSALTEIA